MTTLTFEFPHPTLIQPSAPSTSPENAKADTNICLPKREAPLLDAKSDNDRFDRADLLAIAQELLNDGIQEEDAMSTFGLYPGEVTLLRGPSDSPRSRFIIGLLYALLPPSNHPLGKTIWCFNLRWPAREAMRAFLKFELNRSTLDPKEALIQGIERLEYSGICYDTTTQWIGEICTKVERSHAAVPGRLVVIDGLEYFGCDHGEHNLNVAVPENLARLEQLAKTTGLPVLVACPALRR